MSIPVMAAEEEEEDNFTTMPNYRWENQSTTDSAVQERLIGDQYEVYNYNNETTGTQKFEKSRELNSRDFYYESRFALDVGGNQTEYFRDQLGDSCDFEEDVDGWNSFSGAAGLTIDDGLLLIQRSTSDTSWGASFENTIISTDIYTKFIIRLKAVGVSQYNLRVGFDNSQGTKYDIVIIAGVLPTEWTIYEVDLTAYSSWITSVDFVSALMFYAATVSSGKFYVDYIKLISDLDYATHVEDEIEDTWDFEDSSEYWFTEELNVSDFNDGTTEGWDGAPFGSTIENLDGWLNVSETHIELGCTDTGLSIDASIYKYLAIEVYVDIGTIDYIQIKGANPYPVVFIDNTDITEGSYYLLSGELTGDWTGTETEISIDVIFKVNQYNEFHINMTYLYDTELGDKEGVSELVDIGYQFVNPEGYLTSFITGNDPSFDIISGASIDGSLFDHFIIRSRYQTKSELMQIFWWYNEGADFDWVNFGPVGTDWTELTLDLSQEENWVGEVISKIRIDPIIEPVLNTPIDIDYVLLTGHWSETDGFKFSLLNADDEEGMSFQFIGNADNSYNISIDMYDSVGIALGYSYSFDYSIDTDGWLRLRVDWHLDKKNAKVLLEFDNGTDILNVRSITTLYGTNVGFSRLLLLEDGFPSLCLNNSISGFAKSYVIIDYIDADWNILEWREPTGSWTYTPVHTVTQDADTDFTAISPYGCTLYKKNVSAKSKWYQLAIDRFDGLSFDYKGRQEGIDTLDYLQFNFAAYNIHKNGSLEPLLRFLVRIRPAVNYITHKLYVGSSLVLDRESVASECEGSFSLYYESSSKMVMQYKYSDENDDFQGTLTSRPFGEELFTKEMVFILSYQATTANSGFDDDIIEFNIGGFELTRKDLLGWLVGQILGPFFQLIGIIFSPFIILFQILTLALVKAFRDLLAGLQPFFDILGDIFGEAISGLGAIFGTIIDGLEEAFGGIIEGLGELLEGAINGLWEILFGLVELLGQFLYDVVEWLLPVLAGLAEIIITFLAAILDWFWVAFLAGTPIGFLIEIGVEWILAAPAIFMGIINLFLFWQFWILIGIWVIVLPMQAAQCEGISDFIERILGIFCIDVLPVDIAGFGGWFPLAIPLVFWTCSNIIVLV